MVDQGASLEELEVDPGVGALSLVDLLNVEALAVLRLVQQEGANADWPSGEIGCPQVVLYPQCLSRLIHQCIPPLPLLPPLQEQPDLRTKNRATGH